VLRLKSKAETQKQESEKFYLQRCERKGCMVGVQPDWKPVVPQLSWTSGFIVFYCQWEEHISARIGVSW
jgi:hypothetical protein